VSVTCNAVLIASTTTPSLRSETAARIRAESHLSDVSASATSEYEHQRSPSVHSGGASSILLEEPILSRCSLWARLSIPLQYIFGDTLSGGEKDDTDRVESVRGQSLASKPLLAPPSVGPPSVGPAWCIARDPFANQSLKAYPSSLSLRTYVSHKPSSQPSSNDRTEDDLSSHDDVRRGPAVSTSIDTSGAGVHVLAGLRQSLRILHKGIAH
jgi:hypothetical protein